MKIIASDLTYGDGGKGTTVDFLSDIFNIKNVIRFNGACQAAHNVKVGSLSHTFSQFGSATFNDAKTILSKYMLIEPVSLFNEADSLIEKGFDDVFQKIFISENCIIIVPLHKLICRLKELSRGKNRHGSVGLGVGEAVMDQQRGLTFRVKDLFKPELAKSKLFRFWASKLDIAEQLVDNNPDNQEMKDTFDLFIKRNSFEDTLSFYFDFLEKIESQILSDQEIENLIDREDIIFEGAQGTLLDPNHGFIPYVTSTNCTTDNALSLLRQNSSHALGIFRAYSTRHGCGPFPVEEDLDISEEYNSFNPWQREFRVGWLDLLMLRYSFKVNYKIDSIALTCVDKLTKFKTIKVCTHYYYKGNNLTLAQKCFVTDVNEPRKLLDLKTFYLRQEIHSVLKDCVPIYKNFKSWESINNPKTVNNLPKELIDYIDFIEEHFSVPVSLISYGPDRSQKMFLQNISPSI